METSEQKSVKATRLFAIMSRAIEFCMIITAIAVAGLLIAQGVDMNAAASGDWGKTSKGNALQAVASLSQF